MSLVLAENGIKYKAMTPEKTFVYVDMRSSCFGSDLSSCEHVEKLPAKKYWWVAPLLDSHL